MLYLYPKQQHKPQTSQPRSLMHPQKGSCCRAWLRGLKSRLQRWDCRKRWEAFHPVFPFWKQTVFPGWPNVEVLRLSLLGQCLCGHVWLWFTRVCWGPPGWNCSNFFYLICMGRAISDFMTAALCCHLHRPSVVYLGLHAPEWLHFQGSLP